MFVEAFHRVFKRIYLGGKVNKRVDSCLVNLMKYIRDKAFDRLIKKNKGKTTYRIENIDDRHKRNQEMPLSLVHEVEEDKWMIGDSSDEITSYEVRKINNKCSEKMCEMLCAECQICTHMFSCNCTDYLVLSTMCKHIHLVQRSLVSLEIMQPKHVNYSNLITIPIQNKPEKKQLSAKVRLGLWNARSILKKSAAVCDIIQSNRLDMLALTETWLTTDVNNNSLSEILHNLKDFSIVQIPRATGKGGGVTLLHRKAFSISIHTNSQPKSFELLDASLKFKESICRVIVLYRPPPSRKNKLTTNLFFDEFSQYMESTIITNEPILICGDFNLHIDVKDNPDALRFLDFLTSFNLKQHVTGSTHKCGHTLDLIITRNDESLVDCIKVLPDNYSDHHTITCAVECPKPPLSKVLVTYRSNKIDNTLLHKAITESQFHDDASINDLNSLVQSYNDTLKSIYDTIAPVQTRCIRHRPWAPWYSDDLRRAKQLNRQMERKFRKSNLTVDKELLLESCKKYNSLLESSKTSYYKNKIDQIDSKSLFKTIDAMFYHRQTTLPSKESREVLVEQFNDFFTQKISTIRDLLHKSCDKQTTCTVNTQSSQARSDVQDLNEFHLPDDLSVQSTIKSLSSKSCPLDPLPTHLVKNCLPSLLSFITMIVKESLSNGEFPSALKLSYVRPYLKKPDLDKEAYANYRPVANIPFLSKIIEKVVSTQVYTYLLENNLIPSFQSAFRRHHSTETALVRVTNDILMSLDNKQQVALILLDLSAAFDTLDHDILIDRFKNYFNISGKVLEWFQSYLQGRTQSVIIGETISSPRDQQYGVPQGSILGPLLFIMYIAPVQDVILKHNLNCMFYADDTQLYITIDPTNSTCATDQLRSCVESFMHWNANNMLMCNPKYISYLYTI